MSAPKWVVGQTVYVSSNSRHDKGTLVERTVAKVGRKWVWLTGWGGERFDEAGALDGGDYMSPGSVYASREEYEDERRIVEAWQQFSKEMTAIAYRSIPAHMTVERIAEARKLLIEP